jgi:hypothetical protein
VSQSSKIHCYNWPSFKINSDFYMTDFQKFATSNVPLEAVQTFHFQFHAISTDMVARLTCLLGVALVPLLAFQNRISSL